MPTLLDLRPLVLDLLLLGISLLVFIVDLILPPGRRRALGFVVAGLLAALLGFSFLVEPSGTAFSGAYVGGPWVLIWKRIALLAGSLGVLGAVDHVDHHFPGRQGEFWLLLLWSLLGMTLLPGARDLILFVVCFELMGLPLAMLAAWGKSEDPTGVHRFAAEAGLKLYLFSAASTAITLFGLSFVFGLAGSTRLEIIAQTPWSPLLGAAMLITLAGMGFKIGAAPFHLWVPDTYQGAPLPFVAFLSVAPKATGFAALSAICLIAFRGVAEVGQTLLLLGVASITVGNLMALPQTDLKRMLAFSGVAQVGYVLLALQEGSPFGLAMVLFYLVGYVATNMGAFFVLEALAPARAGIELGDIAGLWRRSPWLSIALLVFLLSLAGIPFVVGFWAKLYVFIAVYRAGHPLLVLYGALMATVALWYYLQIARAAWFDEPRKDAPVVVAPALALAIGLCLLLVVGMGIFPGTFLDNAQAAADAFLPP